MQAPALTPAVVQAIAEVAAKAQPCASGASDCVVVSGVERPVVTGTGLGIQPATVTPPADAPPPTTLPPPVSTTVADQLGQPCSSGASVCVSVDGVEQPPAPTPLCGPNLGGSLFPCDPRWPFPGVMPVYGATQDQVDGFNHDCQTMNCIIVRCPDGRIVPFSLRAGCEVPAPATTASTTTTTTPTTTSTGTGTSTGAGTTGSTGSTPTALAPSTASGTPGTSASTATTGSAPALTTAPAA